MYICCALFKLLTFVLGTELWNKNMSQNYIIVVTETVHIFPLTDILEDEYVGTLVVCYCVLLVIFEEKQVGSQFFVFTKYFKICPLKTTVIKL